MTRSTTPTVTAIVDASPCPRVEIVISPMVAGASAVTVWRQVDGDRQLVRGAQAATVSGDAAFVDYEAPLQTPLTYVCQSVHPDGTVDGISAPSAKVTVKEPRPWLQDPINPAAAVPVALVRPQPMPRAGAAVSRRASYAPVTRDQDITITPVAGSTRPVAAAGPRQQPASIPIEIRTTGDVTSSMRDLLDQAFPILLRTGTRVQQLPPLAYLAVPSWSERFIYGPDVTIWTGTGQCVAPPTSPVLIPVRTLDDLADDATTLAGLADVYVSMLNLDRGVHA